MTLDAAHIEELLKKALYLELKDQLSQLAPGELAPVWVKLKPFDKLVVFKLLEAPAAMDFYTAASFGDKYYLLCGFPLASIAPVLEDLNEHQRRAFHQLPRDFYDRMFRQLVSERIEIHIPVNNN